MNRRYLVYLSLGVVFLTLGSSGYNRAYYGVAVVFFALAAVLWRRGKR